MKRSYDSIAAIYDRLSRLVFGSVLVEAQRYMLPFIPPGARVLLVGGGTGWILEEIAKIRPEGLTIDYVDQSPQMIAIAKQRNAGNNKVTFIASSVEDIARDNSYDIMITPFLFDNFAPAKAEKLFMKMDEMLVRKGLWLYADFQNTDRWSQKMLLRVMYVFFRLSCNIEATALPDVAAHFTRQHYEVVAQQAFRKGFILSCIYEKETR